MFIRAFFYYSVVYAEMKPRSGLETGRFHIAKAKDGRKRFRFPPPPPIQTKQATLAVAFLFVISTGIKESA